MDPTFLILMACHFSGIFSHEEFFRHNQLHENHNQEKGHHYYSSSPFYGNHHYAYWYSQQDPTPQHTFQYHSHEPQTGHQNAYQDHYYLQTYSYNDDVEFKQPQYHYYPQRTAYPNSLIEHNVVYDRQNQHQDDPTNYHYQYIPHKYHYQYESHNEHPYVPRKYYDQNVPLRYHYHLPYHYHYQHVPQMYIPRTYHPKYIPHNTDTKRLFHQYVPNFALAFNNTNDRTPEVNNNEHHNVHVNSNTPVLKMEPDENKPPVVDATSSKQENLTPTPVETRANVHKPHIVEGNNNQPEVNNNENRNVQASSSTPVLNIETEGHQPVMHESANNRDDSSPTQVANQANVNKQNNIQKNSNHFDNENHNVQDNSSTTDVHIQTEEKPTPVVIETANNQDSDAQPPAADLEVSGLEGKQLPQETSTVAVSQVRQQTIPEIYIRFGGEKYDESSEESEEN